MVRYAVYFVPEREDPLWALGCQWLGRDPETGQVFEFPPALAKAGLQPELVSNANRYGFHATLKAPFALKPGRSEADLIACLQTFARQQPAFASPSLKPFALGRHLALQFPQSACPRMNGLEAACVDAFEGFRAPLGPAELAKRRQAPLTAEQDQYLRSYGYPYVKAAFHFHMTLSRRMSAAEAAIVQPLAEAHFTPVADQPLKVSELALFKEPEAGAPFHILERARLAVR